MKKAEEFYRQHIRYLTCAQQLSIDEGRIVSIMERFAQQEVEKERKKHTGTSLSALNKRYAEVVNAYVEKFCKKQGLEFEYWVSDKVGEIGVFGDYYFSVREIIHDLDTKQPKGLIMQWQDDGVEANLHQGITGNINYASYARGLRYEDLKIKNEQQ